MRHVSDVPSTIEVRASCVVSFRLAATAISGNVSTLESASCIRESFRSFRFSNRSGPAYDGDIARKTERKQSLVVETDVDAQRPVVDGMADIIHNLALKTGIPPSRRTQTHRLRRGCFTIHHCSPLFPA